jgi:hypothetical protein
VWLWLFWFCGGGGGGGGAGGGGAPPHTINSGDNWNDKIKQK